MSNNPKNPLVSERPRDGRPRGVGSRDVGSWFMVRLCVCLYDWLMAYLSVCIPVCMSVCLSVCMSDSRPLCLPV